MMRKQEEFFEQLYRENQKRLFLYARAVLSDATLADDVVQDTFHTALLHIDDLIHHANPAGWLMKTLKFKIANCEKARARWMKRCVSIDEQYPNLPSVSNPEENIPALLAEIQKVLKPEDYEFLMRFAMDGATHKQLAEELGITVWASQKRLERIRKGLRRNLGSDKKIIKIMSVFLFCGNM